MMRDRWAWLAAIAVLFAGVSNAHAHVHLCFDGQEPAAAVHLADGIDHLHEHPGDGGKHDDVDVDVPNDALAKQVKHDLPALEPLASWTIASARVPRCRAPTEVTYPPPIERRYAQPPLRAPPLR